MNISFTDNKTITQNIPCIGIHKVKEMQDTQQQPEVPAPKFQPWKNPLKQAA